MSEKNICSLKKGEHAKDLEAKQLNNKFLIRRKKKA